MWINYKGEVKNIEDFYANDLINKGKAVKVDDPTQSKESKQSKPKAK